VNQSSPLVIASQACNYTDQILHTSVHNIVISTATLASRIFRDTVLININPFPLLFLFFLSFIFSYFFCWARDFHNIVISSKTDLATLYSYTYNKMLLIKVLNLNKNCSDISQHLPNKNSPHWYCMANESTTALLHMRSNYTNFSSKICSIEPAPINGIQYNWCLALTRRVLY